jgi:hypothetical protein
MRTQGPELCRRYPASLLPEWLAVDGIFFSSLLDSTLAEPVRTTQKEYLRVFWYKIEKYTQSYEK